MPLREDTKYAKSTGIASPGIISLLASDEFQQEFESADLIFAEGMWHYKASYKLPLEGGFFYCLMVKCKSERIFSIDF